MVKIQPVILSGGSGTRLWPLSRDSFPKQLLPLTGSKTMLQEAALRATDPARFHPLMVVANVEHRFMIAEQLREISAPSPTIVLEPCGRNTAAAIAVASLIAAERDPDALVLIMPADHHIADGEAFLRAVDAGAEAARGGALVLFGVRPDSPATGYGYIRAGAPLMGGVHRVDAFAEKPDLATAQSYISDGGYYWNSGIFLLPASVVLGEIERYEPEVLDSAREALRQSAHDLDFIRLNAAAFAQCPATSIDIAVLERTDKAAVVLADFPWTDVGSWSALWELGARDSSDNVEIGDVISENTRGSYLRSDGPLITTVGVEDLVVIATRDAVLVTTKDASQDVKRAVERLRSNNHLAATQHRRMYCPWGWYEGLNSGDRFQVKRITVKPGEKLSLQKHFHRSEHWVVVSGTAEITLDGEQRLLTENESVYIPLGSVHRLANPGKVDLNLIEVQSGPYLGEDDIIRFEDAYDRS